MLSSSIESFSPFLYKTEKGVHSEPVPAVVGIASKGMPLSFHGLRRSSSSSREEKSFIAFAVSIAEPPPTAKITSGEKLRKTLLPATASENPGLTEKAEKRSTVRDSSCSNSANSFPIARPEKDFPATRKIFFQAFLRIKSPSSLLTFPFPRTICASMTSFLISTPTLLRFIFLKLGL